jgi:hypothetical protein
MIIFLNDMDKYTYTLVSHCLSNLSNLDSNER